MGLFEAAAKAAHKKRETTHRLNKEAEIQKHENRTSGDSKTSQATGKAHYSKNWTKAKQDEYNKKYYQTHKYKWGIPRNAKKSIKKIKEEAAKKRKEAERLRRPGQYYISTSSNSSSSSSSSSSGGSATKKASSSGSSSKKKSTGTKKKSSSKKKTSTSKKKSSSSTSSKKKSSGTTSSSSKKSSSASKSKSSKTSTKKSKQTKPLTTKTKLTASQIEDGDEDVKLRTEADNIPDTNYYLFKGADGHFVLTDSDSTKWDLPTTINITDENKQEIGERLKTLTSLFSDNMDTMAKWDKETSADVYEKATMYAFRGEMDKANELVTTGKISRKKKSSSVSHSVPLKDRQYYFVSGDYISHHGVKGQRWGVKRYQNYDGTRIKDAPVRSSSSIREGDAATVAILATYAAVPLATIGVAFVSSKIYEKKEKKKEKQEIDDRVSKSKYKSVKELPKVSTKMSPQESIKVTNPGFPDGNTVQNCALCTTALAMREKGYDVKAQQSSHPWYSDQLFKEAFNAETKDVNATDTKKFEADIVSKQGEGAYGAIGVSWDVGGGHSMFYKVENGKFNIYDGQSGKKQKNSDIYSVINKRDVEITRLDNCEPTNNVLAFVNGREDK